MIGNFAQISPPKKKVVIKSFFYACQSFLKSKPSISLAQQPKFLFILANKNTDAKCSKHPTLFTSVRQNTSSPLKNSYKISASCYRKCVVKLNVNSTLIYKRKL